MILQLKKGLKEIWAPFFWNEKITEYDVSTHGRVRVRKNGLIRKPHITHDGYLRLKLCFGSEGCKMFTVHRLVALTFIPNDDPINKLTVNHKDTDKLINYYDNLEWMTRRENTQLSYGNGRGVGENHNMAKHKEKDIVKVCKLLTKTNNRQDIAKSTGVSESVIRDIHAGHTWTHISSEYINDFIPPRIVGEYHSQAKINTTTAMNICELIDEGYSNKEISTMAGVQRHTVDSIRSKRSWLHIAKDYKFYNEKSKSESNRTLVSDLAILF